MKLYLKLVSALLKTVEPSSDEKKYKKVFYNIMSFIAVFGIMIPMAFLVGVIVYAITSLLIPMDSMQNGIELFIHLVSVFSFVFGLNVIFSVFYFSGDIENLLPLPLKPYQIIGSKFTAALIGESVMEFIIIIAAFAGYIISAGLPFYTWLIAVFGMFTLPVIPLVYCSVICMLIMLLTKAIKNKDTVNKLTGVLTILIITGLAVMVGNSGGFDTEHIAQSIASPSNHLLTVMNCIFPHIQFLVYAMSENSIINLLIYIAINVVCVFLFMLFAQAVYFRTVSGINQSSATNHRSFSLVISSLKEHSASLSYFKKEIKLLFRTPAYFMNCIIINFLWPILLYLVVMLQGQTNFLDNFIYGIQSGDELSVLIFIIAVSALSVLITAANSIASSALTREGKHFAFVKYIPFSYMAQINIKALVSIIISGCGMLIYIIAAGIFLNLGIKFIIFCCIVSFLSVSFVSYFGIFMDSMNPKLIWDDELNALRGNYNIFFNMALAILLEGILCTGAYLLFKFTGVGALMIILIMLVVLMVLNAVCYLLCYKTATKNIDKLSI
ncbi:MAG: hypothetical protein PUG48_01750 [Clostridia bacterium]|nr:hypothetical protein [Clostridia bacterium]